MKKYTSKEVINELLYSNLSIYYAWKNIKNAYENDKFEMSTPTWNKKIYLLDGSCSVSDIQNYLKYIIKKHEKVSDNPLIRIYANKIQNRIIFEIKDKYYPEPLTSERMKLLGSNESKITKTKNGENVPHLEIVEVQLVHCNIVNNYHQQNSRVLYKLIPDKSFGQLLNVSTANF